MLTALKQRVFTVARRAGAFSVVASSEWRRQRLLILCYHGVSLADEHEWNSALYMPPALLRDRCRALARGGYAVLPLEEATRRLYEGTLPRRAVVLTFDDGTYDFYARAVPILREFGFPATVYVPTYYCRFQRPVFDPVIAYLAWKGRAAGSCSAEGLALDDRPLNVATADDRAATTERLRTAARTLDLDASAKDDVARRFAERLHVDYEELLARRLLHLMTEGEIAEVARQGIDVQLHTHRHRTPCDPVLFRREIDDNRRELQSMLGTAGSLRHFCYPSGHYVPEFLPWLRTADVGTATTCDPGLATAEHDPLQLPRFIDTTGQSAAAFEAWASGFAELLPRRTQTAARAGH